MGRDSGRNPFLGGGPSPSDPHGSLRAGNRELVSEIQAELDAQRKALDQQILDATSERNAIETRAGQQWDRLDGAAKQRLSEEHRVLGNEIRGFSEEKEGLREREAELDDLAAAVRDSERAQDRSRDRRGWKAASVSLESRLQEREAHQRRAEEIGEASRERRDTLPEKGSLSESARETFVKAVSDREVER